MFTFDIPNTDASLLTWLLAAAVGLLAAHVSLAWVRIAQRRPGLQRSWGVLLLAACALGSGICAAVLLTLAGEPIPFWLGYRLQAVPLLWLGAVLGCLPVLLVLSYKPPPFGMVLCGTVLGVLAAAAQAGWLAAAGFLPGVSWSLPHVLVALGVMMVSFSIALVLALGDSERLAGRRLGQLGAAAMLGLGLFIGQELMMLGAGLQHQMASAYADQVHDAVLNIISGGLVPVLLLTAAGYLEMRHRQRARIGRRNDFSPRKRRKRHHRPRQVS